jgi:hypothetical protein
VTGQPVQEFSKRIGVCHPWNPKDFAARVKSGCSPNVESTKLATELNHAKCTHHICARSCWPLEHGLYHQNVVVAFIRPGFSRDTNRVLACVSGTRTRPRTRTRCEFDAGCRRDARAYPGGCPGPLAEPGRGAPRRARTLADCGAPRPSAGGKDDTRDRAETAATTGIQTAGKTEGTPIGAPLRRRHWSAAEYARGFSPLVLDLA